MREETCFVKFKWLIADCCPATHDLPSKYIETFGRYIKLFLYDGSKKLVYLCWLLAVDSRWNSSKTKANRNTSRNFMSWRVRKLTDWSRCIHAASSHQWWLFGWKVIIPVCLCMTKTGMNCCHWFVKDASRTTTRGNGRRFITMSCSIFAEQSLRQHLSILSILSILF